MAKKRTEKPRGEPARPRDRAASLTEPTGELKDGPEAAEADPLVAGRRAMELAALELSGEVGYERMTVEALVRRSNSNLDRFYRAYANKAQCFAAGYEVAVDQLLERVLGACVRAPDWLTGMRLALEELVAFIVAKPRLGKGVISEVHVAGGAALVKRKEVFERLSRAIDTARREIIGSRHSPPPITSDFILGGIESAVIHALSEGRSLEEELPGLLYIGVACYFGTAAARREVAKLGQDDGHIG